MEMKKSDWCLIMKHIREIPRMIFEEQLIDLIESIDSGYIKDMKKVGVVEYLNKVIPSELRLEGRVLLQDIDTGGIYTKFGVRKELDRVIKAEFPDYMYNEDLYWDKYRSDALKVR